MSVEERAARMALRQPTRRTDPDDAVIRDSWTNAGEGAMDEDFIGEHHRLQEGDEERQEDEHAQQARLLLARENADLRAQLEETEDKLYRLMDDKKVLEGARKEAEKISREAKSLLRAKEEELKALHNLNEELREELKAAKSSFSELNKYRGKGAPKYGSLHEAAEKGDDIDSVFILLATGADVNVKGRMEKSGGDGLLTPLQIAASNHHPEIIRILHKYGAELEVKDKHGRTAAHEVVLGGGNSSSGSSEETLLALHELGANLNAKDTDGWGPIHYAVSRNDVGTIQALHRSSSADLSLVGERDGFTPAHVAASWDAGDALRALKKCGVTDFSRESSSGSSSRGRTPLQIAKAGRRDSIVKILIDELEVQH